jgi:acyl-CoA thioesterase-1
VRRCVSWAICLYLLSLPVVEAGNIQRQPRLNIMPLGDSITAGYGQRDSYRWHLWHLIRQDGSDVDFVGSVRSQTPLDGEFDADHEGHWGFFTTDILNNLLGWLAVNTPDVVLLHIGTNDVGTCRNVDEIADTIEEIIDVIRGHQPKVAIMLAKIIPINYDGYCPTGQSLHETVRQLNQRLGALATKKSGVMTIDLYSSLDPKTDFRDPLHPNDRGFQKMAQKWFQALKPVLRR